MQTGLRPSVAPGYLAAVNENIAPTHVASLKELVVAKRLVREVEGVSVLLLFTGGSVVAIRNACTHLGLPLETGRLMAGQIHCPFHGACFDLTSGRAMSGPAVAPLQKFPVSVSEDEVWVTVSPNAGAWPMNPSTPTINR